MKYRLFKSLALGTLSGLLLGLSQPLYMPSLFGEPGYYQWLLGLLALIGYVPLFLELREASLKKTFGLSFYTMTIQYVIVLYWIYIAVHDYGGVSMLPSLIITLCLPFLMALKGAVFFTLGRFISMHFAFSFFLIAPVALCSLEYFRNFYIFGGFPWGNVGYSIARIPEFLQLASVIGVYGLVFVVGVVNALLCMILKSKSHRTRAMLASSLAVLLVFFYGFGYIRLKSGEHEFAPVIKAALLQANISQDIKNLSRLHEEDILKQYLLLQRKAHSEGALLMIWPESAHPYTFNEKALSLNLEPIDQLPSVVGAMSYGFGANRSSYYHNSAFLSDYQGKVIHRYDKTHLVPFGEYVPWPMSGIVKKIVPGMGAFHPGTSFLPQDLLIGPNRTISIGTTICYEGIFPEISRAYAKKGAMLLVNITNDAWYGYSSAPFQHLLMYQLRSVETGRSYLRATNSGLSAWIDVYGRAHRTLGLFQSGVQIVDVPLFTKNTIYDRIGDIVPIACLLLFIIAYVLAVVPLKKIWRTRQWTNMLILIVFLGIPIGFYFYYSEAQFATVESAQTKKFFIFILSMIILAGALSNSNRSRIVLFSCASAVLVVSLLLAIFESTYFLFGIVLAALVFFLAMRKTKSR